MSSKTTFLIPDFDNSVKNKVSDLVKIVGPTSLILFNCKSYYRPAIATTGFRSNVDGTYVFAVKINNIKDSHLFFGFTDTRSIGTDVNDVASCGYPGMGLSGTSLCCFNGICSPGGGTVGYLSSNITSKAKEIVAVLVIANGGKQKQILYIVDGNEGPLVDCTKDFEGGNEIFPCASFGGSSEQYVEFISLDQIKTRSPLIDQLLVPAQSSNEMKKKNEILAVSANNNNNNISHTPVNDNNSNQPTSISLFRLQQELSKERRQTGDLESQLRTEKANSASKDQQLQREKQNSSWLTSQLRQKDQLVQEQSAEIDRLRQLLKDKQ